MELRSAVADPHIVSQTTGIVVSVVLHNSESLTFTLYLPFAVAKAIYRIICELMWARQDSNLGPLHYQCNALTN